MLGVDQVITDLELRKAEHPSDRMDALDERSQTDAGGDLMSKLSHVEANSAHVSDTASYDQSDAVVPIPKPAAGGNGMTGEEAEIVAATLAAERRVQKEKPQEAHVSPSMRKMGPILGKAMPGSQKVRVHKRVDGRLAYVGEYADSDLGTLDMESYIAKYIQPTKGGGEYVLTGITQGGQLLDGGSVNLFDDPAPAKPHDGLVDLVQDILRRQEVDRKEMFRMMTQPAPPQQNPVALLRDVIGVQKDLNEQSKSDASGGFGSMVQAMSAQGTGSMTMVLEMMRQQSEQQSQSQQNQMNMMMTMLSQPKTDPIMVALLQRLTEKKEDHSAMMPPPPPPMADPMETLEKTIRVVGEIMKPREDPDRLSTRDIIELVRGNTSAVSGADDFKRAAENMNVLMSLASGLKQQSEPGASAGFFDALANLFGNRDFAASLAGGIRAKTGGAPALPPPQQPVQLPPQVIEAFRRQEAARVQQEARIRQLEDQLKSPALLSGTAGTAAVPAVVTTPLASIAVQPPPAVPEIPQEILDHINAVEQAFKSDDEMQMVEAVAGLLGSISQVEDVDGFWGKLSAHIFQAIEKGDKNIVLQYISAFFEAVHGRGITSNGLNEKIVSLVDAHFDLIVESLEDDEDDEDPV